jgi:hypothetical protein
MDHSSLFNMTDWNSKKLEKLTKTGPREMNAVTQDILRDYAGHKWPGLNHKGRIARLAGHLGFAHRRVRSLYQNEPGIRVRADEAARIEALREEQHAIADTGLEARLAALEEELATLRAEVARGIVTPSGERPRIAR